MTTPEPPAPRRRVAINVPVLARVEGEGALDLVVENDTISELRLRIYEPPRYFEKFLEGRAWHEVPDIVARICGICPVAYQMSAVHAIEQAFAIDPGPWVRAMRRLLYCGEWIESHALHIHLLAAPDFLGYSSAPEMARDHAAVVRRGLRLQHLGNEIIGLLGGRAVHPVGVRVGGFHKAPDPKAAAELRSRIDAALPDAAALVGWAASLPLPQSAPLPFPAVSLKHDTEYPMNEGAIASSTGFTLAKEAYESRFTEHHVPYSTALHGALDGAPYLVGPLARLALNQDRLPDTVRDTLDATGVAFPSANRYHAIVARAVEIHYALTEAQRLLREYSLPDAPGVAVTPGAGEGFGATEAPRGLLWHHYELDDQGLIRSARIVPPTSQNQGYIEADLRATLTRDGLHRPDDTLRLQAETIIRNYDPCISCATHFLDLRIRRQ